MSTPKQKQEKENATESAARQDTVLTAARKRRAKLGVIPVLVGQPRIRKTPEQLLAEMDKRSLLKRQRFDKEI